MCICYTHIIYTYNIYVTWIRTDIFREKNLTDRGMNLVIYSSNSFGKSDGVVRLETSPSKVAELQSGESVRSIESHCSHSSHS